MSSASSCVEKLPHRCDPSDATLQVFLNGDGTYTGYCFRCSAYEKDPYKEHPVGYKPKVKRKSAEEIEKEITEIESYPTKELPNRGLFKEYLEYFGVKVGLSEQDGVTPSIACFPYSSGGVLKSYKLRLLDQKRMWSVGDQSNVDLFGWEQAISSGAKRLLITEGEFDAVALFQTIKESNKNHATFKDFNPAVCSLPHGAGSALKDISKLLPKITRHFKEVVLVFDNDEAGRTAATNVSKILPTATSAELPGKDPNECLLAGQKKAMIAAVMFKAEKKKNTRLVWGRDLHERARKSAEWGVSWPWKKITELTRGIRKGETIYIGAGQKMGKSEIVNTVAAWLMVEHHWKVLLAKPEEGNEKSYKMLAGKVVGKIFHDPKVEFDYDAYDRAGAFLQDNCCMIDLYQHLGWESLKEDIKSAVAEGIDAVFIDPITNLTNGMSAADANTKLQEIAQELAAMAKDLNIVIFIFCHLRNPDAGPPHDRGGKVLTSQFAGSRAMGRSCNYMFGLEGNKDEELPPQERNLRKFGILDDREFGAVGSCMLYWDEHTSLFNEV